MEMRFLRGHEVEEAILLMRRVFLKTIALSYDKEGIDNFLKICDVEKTLSLMKNKQLIMLGAFEDKMLGIIGIKDLKHIQSLFVDVHFQHQEIGKNLLEKAKLLMNGIITVNSDFHAIGFYQKCGFKGISEVKTIDGITFMEMEFKSKDEMIFRTYDDVNVFINNQKSRVYALDNFKKFMTDLCNPQSLLKTIHIGGTNGKGSTTNYIRSVLEESGYNIATFTSPALVSRLDIMKVNNQSIQDDKIVRYANRYMSLWLEYELSLFEIEVFIAIMYFIEKKVDFALFEVGMGGELDATNIVSPLISVNTNIGLDHVEYLGDTYEKIAYTKGGIIKDYTPFVTGEEKDECLKVFEDLCEQHQSPFMKIQEIKDIIINGNITYQYRGYQIVLDTPAVYQCKNSALAIDVLLYLKSSNYIELEDKVLLSGLKKAIWAGRFEVVCEDPLIIIDGAHNSEGIDAFYQSASRYKNIKIIFSALKDKDTHSMIERLLELTKDVTICQFDYYRAQDAKTLAEDFPVKIEKNWKTAVDHAFLHDGVTFITGSLYFIALVRPYIQKQTCIK